MKGQTRMDNPEKLAALGTYDRRRRQTRQKTQHYMCWTQLCARYKPKTNKTKTQHIYVGHHYA